jgi:hypothetical protein
MAGNLGRLIDKDELKELIKELALLSKVVPPVFRLSRSSYFKLSTKDCLKV